VHIFAAVEQAIAAAQLPASVYASVEGQLRERVRAMRQMALLGLVSLALILLVLYARYRSFLLSAIVLVNVPLALVGSVIALAAFGQALSLASVVGFITLAGIATRNGILKLSHYLQLVAREGETFGRAMIVRGSRERLAPVLMTSLGAALALLPLLVSPDAPGKEILHPVAATIFGGLISATLLDTLLTPILFLRYGEAPLRRLLERSVDEQAF
jgi:HME family heavy-metal exporter